MGIIKRFSLILIILSGLVLAGAAPATGRLDDEIVIGGDYEVGEDEVLEGSLLVVGGSVSIRSGGRVNGDLTMIGGEVLVDGQVEGDIRQLGGRLLLEADADIAGDVLSNGGSLVRDEGARVDGSVRSWVETENVRTRQPGGVGRFILESYWNLFMLFSLAAVSVLVATLWPKHLDVIGEVIIGNPVLAGGVGLLTIAVAIPVLVICALTLILIPVSLTGFLVLGAGGAIGWVALSYETGRRITAAAKADWVPGVAAGVGAIVLGVIYLGIDRVPCVGWAMQAAIGLIGLGAVVLTWFGMRPYQTA